LDEANEVVVLFAGALGDVLLALPALRVLRARHTGATVVLGVRGPLVALVAAADCADRVVALDDVAMARFLGGGVPPPWWAGRPLLYSWFGGGDAATRARLAAHAARARFLSVERGAGPRHAALAYTDAVEAALAWPALCRLARLAVAPSPAAAGCAPVLVVHGGAGALAKRWYADGFAAVAAWWRGRGGTVAQVIGPAERGQPRVPGAQPLADLPLPVLAAVLAGAQAFVGNDSGPSHLAAAVGARGVVLFGPTDPVRWRPLSTRMDALRAPAGAWCADGFALPAAHEVIAHLEATLP
jgi:ADP-heptose:LPS heptosyltransferase